MCCTLLDRSCFALVVPLPGQVRPGESVLQENTGHLGEDPRARSSEHVDYFQQPGVVVGQAGENYEQHPRTIYLVARIACVNGQQQGWLFTKDRGTEWRF